MKRKKYVRMSLFRFPQLFSFMQTRREILSKSIISLSGVSRSDDFWVFMTSPRNYMQGSLKGRSYGSQWLNNFKQVMNFYSPRLRELGVNVISGKVNERFLEANIWGFEGNEALKQQISSRKAGISSITLPFVVLSTECFFRWSLSMACNDLLKRYNDMQISSRKKKKLKDKKRTFVAFFRSFKNAAAKKFLRSSTSRTNEANN